MLSFYARAITAACFGAVLIGCGGAPEDPGESIDAPLSSAMGGPSGSGGVDGLNPDHFHANKKYLIASASTLLAAAWPANVHALAATQANNALLSTAGGRESLRRIVLCSLDKDDWVYGGNPTETFSGGGVMTTTADWRTVAPTLDELHDLFACVVVLLSPFDDHVPVFLSGPSVASALDASSYTFHEAVWTTELFTDSATGQPRLRINAWPHPDLISMCGADLTASLKTQICGSPSGACDLVIRADFSTACAGSSGSWVCDGAAAVETRLRATDVDARHPLCAL